MTDPTTELVEVTQEDRDFAARVYQDKRDHDYAGVVRTGRADGDHWVQLAARHRLSTRSPAPEQVEVAARRMVEAWESLPGPREYSVAVMQNWISGPMTNAINRLRAALGVSPR